MTIELKKFGTTLVFRQAGKEAFSAFQSSLESVANDEEVIVNFEGVLTFSPSWGDEFLTPLFQRFGKNLKLKNIQNPSVKATLEILKQSRDIDFIVDNSS
jgi:hypothetical protein